jgi:hypothetical protein
MKKASFILVARNDNYCGNSLERLTNTLNFLGKVLHETGNLENAECILTDWCSPNEGLKDCLNLNSHIKSILKIVIVPKDIGFKYQGESPFSEVHAMNCCFRRMSGKYFLRIDQDTLVGYRFVNWFFNEFGEKSLGFTWPKAGFSGRRNLSKKQTPKYKKIILNKKTSRQAKVFHPHNYYNLIDANGTIFTFFGAAVGVMLIERDIYEEEKGFNEDMVYMNQMDVEFFNRLIIKTPIYNISQKTNCDFYHQFHEIPGSDNPSLKRPKNSILFRNKPFKNSNDDNWGLKNEDLEVFTYVK